MIGSGGQVGLYYQYLYPGLLVGRDGAVARRGGWVLGLLVHIQVALPVSMALKKKKT